MSLYVEMKKDFKEFSLDMNFSLEEKQLGILGASGSGKSMTLKCIAGIERPDSGRIVLNGKVLFDSDKKINLPPQKRQVGYLFQNYALFPNMTVKENIGIGIRDKSKRKQKIQDMMSLLQIEELANRYPAQLSGGQQQRVALGRMLAYEPEVLLLDEPFSALDTYLKDQLKQELLDLIKEYQGHTIMVSHNRDELFQFSNQMVVVDQGRMLLMGNTTDLFHKPRNVTVARLTGCKNIQKVEKRSDDEVYVKDWNVILKTNEKISSDIDCIGIRSHDIRPSRAKESVNTIAVELVSFSEEPFVNFLILRPKEAKGKDIRIWWKITKAYWESTLQKQIPSYIHLPKEHIMLLTEE